MIVILGLISRLFPLGFLLWDKYLGDILYAAFFYLILSLIWPTGSVLIKSLLIAVFVVTIETFQLTPVPRQLNHSSNLLIKTFAYLVLGSQFSGWDLLAYAIGISGITLLDKIYLNT